jgi:HlyD family secretion protein
MPPRAIANGRATEAAHAKPESWERQTLLNYRFTGNCRRCAPHATTGAVMADQLTADLESLKINRDEPQRPPGSGGLVRVIVWLVVLGALAAVGVYFYPKVQAAIFKTEVAMTEITVISPAQAATQLTATGYVVAMVRSRVAPRVLGRVSRVLVHEGDVVTQGQVLLELDASNQESARAAANARVLAARARVATAEANLADGTQQAERQRPLVERGVAPRQTYEDLASRASSLRAQVAAANAEVRAAQAEVAMLSVGISQYTVEAPIAGTILDKPPEVGEALSPELQSVLEIADMSSLVIEVDVPETRVAMVRIGSPCEIVLDAFPGRRFRGATLEIGHRVNRSKATVPVKVRFTEANEGVLPEMSARVSF